MTRYKKHMQRIHSQATARSIEMAILLLTDDIIDFLVKSGVKEDASILKDIRNLSNYEYNPKIKIDGN